MKFTFSILLNFQLYYFSPNRIKMCTFSLCSFRTTRPNILVRPRMNEDPGGSVVEYLTQDRDVVGLSLTEGTALCP